MNSQLIKRKLVTEDYPLWCRDFVPTTTPQDFENMLKEMNLLEQQDKSFSFVLEEESKLVGFIQIFNILRYPANSGMIEIMISEQKRKLGYAKKGMIFLENFCFNDLGLLRLIAPILPENHASISLFTSLGYQKYFTDPSAFFFGGKPVAHDIYVKLKPDTNH